MQKLNKNRTLTQQVIEEKPPDFGFCELSDKSLIPAKPTSSVSSVYSVVQLLFLALVPARMPALPLRRARNGNVKT
jgi:hypothetical protein